MSVTEIKNHFTGEVMCGGLSLKLVLEYHKKWLQNEAGGERAYLSGADLSNAYLRGADLSGADLRGADLSGADLRDTYLRGADLRGADLSGADLRGADLRGADLRDTYLRGADLRGDKLSGADLSNAYLRGAYLSDADLRGDKLSGVPKIESIHQTVYAAVSQQAALEMGAVHTCKTTHCRAGWVVHLAGEAGTAMEWCLGWSAAASLIYLKSDPTLERIPDFYASNEDTLADMKRLAELEKDREAICQ